MNDPDVGSLRSDEPSSPQFRASLSAEPMEVALGEPARLTWVTEGARQVRLWRSAVMPFAPAEALDWARIVELGEVVPTAGEREVAIDRDTAFYLVGMSDVGVRGIRLTVEVRREVGETQELVSEPPGYVLEKMEEAPHIVWPEDGAGAPESLSLRRTPVITLDVTQPVIFSDESTEIRYKASNAACVEYGYSGDYVKLVATPSGSEFGHSSGFVTGTKPPPVCLPNPGSIDIVGPKWAQKAGGGGVHLRYSVYADGASVGRWVDVLGTPKFATPKDATPPPSGGTSDIRTSLKDIDKRLREGRLYPLDGFLDSTVLAFKKNCFNSIFN